MDNRFSLRRAIERLRDGLFDPVAVTRLTMGEVSIKKKFSKGLDILERGKSEHLCICGSYGQGKSHTITYLNQLALSLGFATSVVQLDPREVPLHSFAGAYQSIMEKLSLPDGKKFTNAWKNWAKIDALGYLDTMPLRFRLILQAMLCKNRQLSSKERARKKHKDYRPREYGYWLEKALMGYNIPAVRLKNVFKYRQVENHRGQSLSCRGNDPYVQMVQSLGITLREMGYKGLVLFFDEAESTALGRLSQRVKSYHILDQFFQGHSSVFPVFAFTDDFFAKVNHEPYDDERGVFPKNYQEAWRDLNILRLQDFSPHEWELLLTRLMQLYSEAYQIDLPPEVQGNLQLVLNKLQVQETRFKLKALVNKLDLETQAIFLNA